MLYWRRLDIGPTSTRVVVAWVILTDLQQHTSYDISIDSRNGLRRMLTKT